MKKIYLLLLLSISICVTLVSFIHENNAERYTQFYFEKLDSFETSQKDLLHFIKVIDINNENDIQSLNEKINLLRLHLKGIDFWCRYLEPVMYNKINGPLPVEWETEVFEKFEKPYRREGSGITLAQLYLDEKDINKDSLLHLIESSSRAMETFMADSITHELRNYHHFYLANKLFY